MSINIIFEKGDRGVRLEYVGVISGEEARKAINSVFSSHQFSSLEYWIGDFSNAEKFDISPEDVNEITTDSIQYALLNPALLVALVRPNNEIRKTLSLYEKETKLEENGGFGHTVVFTELENARTWIKNIRALC